MAEELIKAFHKAKYEERPNLAENIWHNIVIHNKRITRFKLWIFSFIGFFSLIGFISVWKTLSNDLVQSGLYEYLSLAFSNGSSILSYWKELTLSIAESLPTTSIILSLSFVFILFLSLKYIARHIIRGQLSLSF